MKAQSERDFRNDSSVRQPMTSGIEDVHLNHAQLKLNKRFKYQSSFSSAVDNRGRLSIEK